MLTTTSTRVYRCPTATGARSSHFFTNNRSKMRNTAKYTPQSAKFQSAPCQKPVRNQTAIILNSCRGSGQRLPPSGIYTYSRNQVPSVICQRRQNSVIEREIK